ncbi:unnamed protein product [Rotaria sp. Silwood1]|nr:unnamed protein product [Rotaria sp. Silwood1]CAF3698563.1 unnamed protein product [Rotaria sp. Silwood1]CAF3714367.1 unnamed protein product [Rotaria sp. Silwood1]CAF4963336.1 unnamed protein product [Rotaria sp. Silwood1]CAF5040675.1 unnamed protein product [Rotaria sp. Silwood1]
MHIIERELKLLMTYSGRSLLHAELNGSTTLSSTTASNLISRPTSSTNNIHSSNSTMMQIHSDSSNNQNSSHNLYTNQSTLATPNLNRLQTLT